MEVIPDTYCVTNFDIDLRFKYMNKYLFVKSWFFILINQQYYNNMNSPHMYMYYLYYNTII